MVEDFSTQFHPLYRLMKYCTTILGHPVYRVSDLRLPTRKLKVDWIKPRRKVMYHFAKFAIVIELLMIKNRRISPAYRRIQARGEIRPPSVIVTKMFTKRGNA